MNPAKVACLCVWLVCAAGFVIPADSTGSMGLTGAMGATFAGWARFAFWLMLAAHVVDYLTKAMSDDAAVSATS